MTFVTFTFNAQPSSFGQAHSDALAEARKLREAAKWAEQQEAQRGECEKVLCRSLHVRGSRNR